MNLSTDSIHVFVLRTIFKISFRTMLFYQHGFVVFMYIQLVFFSKLRFLQGEGKWPDLIKLNPIGLGMWTALISQFETSIFILA